jgi:hypothetical protein
MLLDDVEKKYKEISLLIGLSVCGQFNTRSHSYYSNNEYRIFVFPWHLLPVYGATQPDLDSQ